VLEGVSTRDVVDEERASRATVVGAGDGAEGLLSGRVPDLEFDLFVGDGDHAGTKLDADCEIVDGLEAFVGELEEEAGFSHSCVLNWCEREGKLRIVNWSYREIMKIRRNGCRMG